MPVASELRPMPPAPKHTRRWFQYSLGTFLWLMLTAALLVFGLNERYKRAEAESASVSKEASLMRQLAQTRKQAADEQRKRHRYQDENSKLRRAEESSK
jgi:hypothetical protein